MPIPIPSRRTPSWPWWISGQWRDCRGRCRSPRLRRTRRSPTSGLCAWAASRSCRPRRSNTTGSGKWVERSNRRRRTLHGQRRHSHQAWQDLPRELRHHPPQEEKHKKEAGRRGGEDGKGGRAVRALWIAGIVLLGAAPITAQQDDRWQITLNDGRILWELHFVRFRGDTLVVQQSDSTFRFPINQVDELRLVRKAERRQTAEPNRYGGVLGGADDEVFRLTLYDLAERRQIVAQIFKDHPPAPSP